VILDFGAMFSYTGKGVLSGIYTSMRMLLEKQVERSPFACFFSPEIARIHSPDSRFEAYLPTIVLPVFGG
jgi:hypothetical protein